MMESGYTLYRKESALKNGCRVGAIETVADGTT
ncbi:hypothetical protein IGK47_004646 [Enterococcus sp. AZ007]